MPILGITGGVASGKTRFRKLLLERVEADFFDADACARELLEEDKGVREEVSRKIHPDAYDAEGHPNRALLRELIFQDADRKKTLEAILHPVIRARWSQQAREASEAKKLFVVDIPLLFETRAESLFDHIVMVACTVETQLKRMATQRGLTREISEKIIAAQLPMSVKMAKAHHVVWNDGPVDALTTQADIFSRYLHVRYH